MYKDKRGLSTVVTTLIIILLVLVAVGIIWVVVRNLIETGSEDIDLGTQCTTEVDVRATAVDNCVVVNSYYRCNVSVVRESGSVEIGGVKLVFHNTTSDISGNVVDVNGTIGLLSTKATSQVNTTLTVKPDQVDVLAYFKDASGNDYICPQKRTFNF